MVKVSEFYKHRKAIVQLPYLTLKIICTFENLKAQAIISLVVHYRETFCAKFLLQMEKLANYLIFLQSEEKESKTFYIGSEHICSKKMQLYSDS